MLTDNNGVERKWLLYAFEINQGTGEEEEVIKIKFKARVFAARQPAEPFNLVLGSMLRSRVFVMNLCNCKIKMPSESAQYQIDVLFIYRPSSGTLWRVGYPSLPGTLWNVPDGLWLEGVAFWGVDVCCKINHWQGIITTFIVQYGHCSHSASGSIILQAHVTTSFWRDTDVVIMSCVTWECWCTGVLYATNHLHQLLPHIQHNTMIPTSLVQM